MRLTAALVLALTLAAPAAAQQRPSPFAGDHRLDKPVTVHWKKATLFDALQTVSRLTGAKIVPERTIVDEPIMASAASVPARELLEQIGKLLHFTWARSGGKPEAPDYLLYRDRKSLEEEDAEINGARRAVLEALQQEIERYRRAARLPPDRLEAELRKADDELKDAFSGGLANLSSRPQMAKRFQDGQALRSAASPVGRTLIDLLESLPSGTWELLQSEDPLILSSRPGPGEERLPEAISNRLARAKPEYPFPKDIFRSLGSQVEEALGQAEGMMQKQWSGASGFKVTIHLTLTTSSQPVGMLRVSPEPLAEGITPALFAIAGLNLTGAPALLETPTEDPAEREKRLAADPFLGRKAVLKLPPLPENEAAGPFAFITGKAHRVAEVLPSVEEAFHVRLLGDAYNRQAMSFLPARGKAPVPLFKVLDQMAGMTRAWERDGDTVRFRSKTWAHDRRGEIPARYMRRWLANREKRGGFTLDDLAEIASLLRDEQVDSLMFSALEEGAQEIQDFAMIAADKQPLRFYARLLPLQRRQLLSGRSLPVRNLFGYQQAALAGMNREQNRSMFSIAFGTKPARRPEQLAAAVVTLEHADTSGPAAEAGARARRKTGLPVSIPSGIYTLRLTFPDGQKDEFVIPLSKPAPPTAPKPGPPVEPAK